MKKILVLGLVFASLAMPVLAEEAPTDTKAMPHGHMMDGKMDMKKMHAMMGDCMKMHKDGKMCEGQTMEQCQKTMDKAECSKMLKDKKK